MARLTSSYGFGTTVNSGTSNTHGASPSGVLSVSALTQANSGDSDTNRWSGEAWDFGTSFQAPALKYVDSYEKTDNTYTCTSTAAFLPSIDITCGTTLLPKQPSRICSDPETTDSALPGAGTVDDPFVLCSSAHLSLIGTNTAYTLSASYVMGQDIDLNNEPFTPIAGVFTGTFDGKRHKIMNLVINTSGHAALFFLLGSGGSIKNLGIEGFDVTGTERVGSLVATSSGAITNCYAVDSDDSTDLSGGASDDEDVGGLVGRQADSGSITSSYATGDADGGAGSGDNVGGLVGRQEGGFIISSYATGHPDGGEGDNGSVGGLVGRQAGGRLTSSYATGNPHSDGGSGTSDFVGGLVGYQTGGRLTSSYATGSPRGGDGAEYVGGLVGYQGSDGTITSSYATGHPDGGGGAGDYGGVLVGSRASDSTITSSYGFGELLNTEIVDAQGTPPSGVTANGLTQANSGNSDTNRWSDSAWDFGTSFQAPVLKYVDSYGDHDNDASTSDAYTCTSTLAFLPPIEITCGTTLLPNQPSRVCNDLETTDGPLPGAGTVDDPFVLCSPAHLSLIGDTGADPAYTLSASYMMGQGIDLNNELFTPIAGVFTGTFDGRGHKIMNLAINTNGYAGLFYALGLAGHIKNLGIEEFDVVGSTRVGALVAVVSGTITNCYAVDSDASTDLSGSGGNDYVGGLVGYLGGSMTSSYATGDVDGGGGNDNVGGLVGRQNDGSITSSYATGDPDGGDGSGNDEVGGLVGYQTGGSITSSYATGNPDGSGGNDNVGGLVGIRMVAASPPTITPRSPPAMPQATPMGVGVVTMLAAWWGIRRVTVISSPAMPQATPMEGRTTVTMLAAWWDIRRMILATSLPAMPQATPMGGRVLMTMLAAC